MNEELTAQIIKVDQKSEPSVLLLLAEANQLREYAIARVITTIDDVKAATNDLSLIAKLKKTMEGKRKDYLQPFQEHVKEVNDDYKILMGCRQNHARQSDGLPGGTGTDTAGTGRD